jgi:hypothetical protein
LKQHGNGHGNRNGHGNGNGNWQYIDITWPRTQTWTWNWQTFDKYFIRRNCPYSAIWNASEIARRYFQWRYILVAPLQYGKKSYRCWNSFPNDVLAE